MPRNLELKAPIPSLDGAREAAVRLGARFAGVLAQTDTYFVVPYGRLKLRVENGLSAELIYYDRQEGEEERWSHYTKFPITDPGGLQQILARSLGTLAVVRKTRLLFEFQQSRIHLDTVDGLGTFIEFEIKDLADEESRLRMDALRTTFSIKPGVAIRASYAELLSARANP